MCNMGQTPRTSIYYAQVMCNVYYVMCNVGYECHTPRTSRYSAQEMFNVYVLFALWAMSVRVPHPSLQDFV